MDDVRVCDSSDPKTLNSGASGPGAQSLSRSENAPPMNEWQIAKHGLVLFLNNEPQKAEEFLKEWIDSSVHVMTSYTFINCIVRIFFVNPRKNRNSSITLT